MSIKEAQLCNPFKKQRQREGEEKKRVEISRLRHQPSGYSPFCLLVLRLTLRNQTQGRSAEERESRGLYRQGCGGGEAGNHSKQLHSSLAGENSSLKKKKRRVLKKVLNTFCNVIHPYIHVLCLSG